MVIHRAIFGSIERFIAILIEHFAGAFPLWLAPVQVIVLPIADRHVGLRPGRGSRPASRGPRGPRSTSARRRSTTRFGRPSSRKFPTCWWWATGRRPKARSPCAAVRRATWAPGPEDVLGRRACRGRRPNSYPSSLCRWRTTIAFDRNSPCRRDDRLRINERIRVREIRVIDDAGQQLGIMPPRKPSPSPARRAWTWWRFRPRRCRRSAGSWITASTRYQEQKRAREAKKHQHVVEVKESSSGPRSTSTTTSSRRTTSAVHRRG